MTNFPGDAVKLEAEIILNRFRCAAELARLANVAENEEARCEHGRSSPDDRESVQQQKLEEIERRITETLERHRTWK